MHRNPTASLHERPVDPSKALGLGGQLLYDVAPRKHGLHARPRRLHRQPALQDLAYRGQAAQPGGRVCSKWHGVPVGRHRPQGHLGILKPLDQLGSLGRLEGRVGSMEV